MTTINELLRQLSEAAPGVCRALAYSDGPAYVIGDYSFWLNSLGEFEAKYKMSTFFVRGAPAHAWLRDAVEREIARRGWSLRTLTLTDGGNSVIIANRFESEWFPLMVEALMTAFIAAIRAATSPAGDAGEL